MRASVIAYTENGQINSKTGKSLLHKVDEIEKSLVVDEENEDEADEDGHNEERDDNDGNKNEHENEYKEALNKLQAFINEVSAQRGKKISEAAADNLIAQAQAIIALISNFALTPTPLPGGEENPTDLLVALRASVVNYVENGGVDKKSEYSLLSKVDAAIQGLADGKINSTINQLGAFTNEVSAQRGKKISEAAADDLIAQAQTIIALLSAAPTPELTMTPVEETPTLANTETPLPTDTPTELPTITPTFPPTGTMTEIPSPTLTFTPSLTPTETLIPTETFTPLPISSPVGTATEIPPAGPLTISYTYDALHRLKSAVYSDGRSFSYIYDANGNTLQASDETTTTTYTYDVANQLVTAQNDLTVWNYTYDGNGSLIEVLPNGNEVNNAKRYTYNVAGYLVKVESHDISGWNTQAEMTYNGLGVHMTSSALGVTTEYASDGQRPLTIASGEKTTEVLYGLGPVAEKTTEWNYVLSDGVNVPRQLTDDNGLTTLAVRYNLWGKPIETNGVGNFDASFIGTLIDATTGLIYIGNGQYYDPETGRFLTRGVYPNSTNPYVPWNPIGAVIGPLGLLSMYYSKKRGKNPSWMVVLIFFIMTTLACKSPCPEGTPTPTPDSTGSTQVAPSPTPGLSDTEAPPPTEGPKEPICKGCTETSEYMGKFSVSAYYILLEEQYGNDSAKWPIYAVVHGDLGCNVVLSTSHKNGGDPYTCETDEEHMLKARWEFLYDRKTPERPNGAGAL